MESESAGASETGPHERLQSNYLWIATLTSVFILCFSAPVLIYWQIHSYRQHRHSESPAVPPQTAYSFSDYGSFLTINGSQDLQPREGEDFLVTFWLRIERWPKIGEKCKVFSKLESRAGRVLGYALVLTRDAESIRPQLYWQNRENGGGWHSFLGLKVLPKQWFLMALSFHKQRYVGLQILYVPPGARKPKVQVLGGQPLEGSAVPNSATDFQIGSASGARYRMEVGPVGVFSKAGMEDELSDALRELALDPFEPPDALQGAATLFWSRDLKTDLSSAKRGLQVLTSKDRAGEK